MISSENYVKQLDEKLPLIFSYVRVCVCVLWCMIKSIKIITDNPKGGKRCFRYIICDKQKFLLEHIIMYTLHNVKIHEVYQKWGKSFSFRVKIPARRESKFYRTLCKKKKIKREDVEGGKEKLQQSNGILWTGRKYEKNEFYFSCCWKLSYLIEYLSEFKFLWIESQDCIVFLETRCNKTQFLCDGTLNWI